ncbi:MAG TPA: thioredoxin family protein [Pirellulales bacterium]|nr:thioredoxin family protein [Pirellulales bacterium]
MVARSRCWLAGIVALLVANTCLADSGGLVWQSDFAAAQRSASQQNRLLLVHFGAPWCQPCLRLEKHVFHQPGFGRELAGRFVAVKLNYDDNRDLALRFGVQAIPADVILTPQGQMIQRVQSPPSAEGYVATMLRAADYASMSLAAAHDPSAPSTAAPSTATPPSKAAPTTNPLDASAAADIAPAKSVIASAAAQSTSESRAAAPSTNPSDTAEPTTPKPNLPLAQQLPPNSPPLGLEGFCPVTLTEQRRWTVGDVRWGAIHHGRTYLFASEQDQQRFLSNPDRYSPVMAGNDPVLAMDDGQTVSGDRRHGVFFANRVYLFRDEDSLKRFSQNPNRYAAEVMQAMR